MNPQQAWQAAFTQLEIQLDRASFETWLRDAIYLGFEQEVFIIGVASSYAVEMLTHRLYRNVRRVVSDVYGTPVELRFELRKAASGRAKAETEMPLFRFLAQQTSVDTSTPPPPLYRQIARPTLNGPPEGDLNPRFTFVRFIVNRVNRLTVEAAQAVAERPAGSYNPLFIHGGVGLGKTHLLQAIAHACRLKNLTAIYVSSEAFTNDLVDAIRNRSTALFRDRYRSADVLLVDDIQFIAGKESTQEEFFHTFNTLYTFNRQVVLASDRHPKGLITLEDRLRSRFQGGLVTELQAPEFETRVAILEMWTHERGVVLPPAILHKIAEDGRCNVRELEGVLNQLTARMRINGETPTLEQTDAALQRFERPQENITVRCVLEITAEYFHLSPDDLTGKRRTKPVSHARHIAMYLAREATAAPLSHIGEIFGGRKHSTVCHSHKKIAQASEDDATLKGEVAAVRARLMHFGRRVPAAPAP